MKKALISIVLLLGFMCGACDGAPTIKTIKPAGGGDFTTLQDWENWADGESLGDGQWAECYSGSDLGVLTFSVWTDPPTTVDEVKIYAAEGERHNATTGDKGAYVVAGAVYAISLSYMPFITIDGIYFDQGAGYNIYATHAFSNVGLVIKNCYFDMGVSRTIMFLARTYGIAGGVDAEYTLYNNIFYSRSGTYATFGTIDLRFDSHDLGDVNGTINFYNNSVVAYNTAAGNCLYVLETSDTYTTTLDVNVYNNAIIADNDAFYIRLANGTVTGDYNAASDTTPTSDVGGTHNVESKSNTDFWPSDGDFTIDSDSDLYEAGTTIAGFSDDCLGLTRPQNTYWDIGSVELKYVKQGERSFAVVFQ